MNDLVGFVKEDAGVAGPLDTAAIGDLELSTHAMDGKYAVPPSIVHKFLCGGMASWIEMLIDETIKVDGTNWCSGTLT